MITVNEQTLTLNRRTLAIAMFSDALLTFSTFCFRADPVRVESLGTTVLWGLM
jgi:hypothetical protein